MKKYKQLVEAIIAEDQTKAKNLFHQIVIEKSRDIYESLLGDEGQGDADDEFDGEQGGDESESIADLITADEAKTLMDCVDSGMTDDVDPELLDKVAEFYGVEADDVLSTLSEHSDELMDVAYGDETDGDEGDDDLGDFGDDSDIETEDLDNGMGDDGDEDFGAPEGGMEDRVMDLETALDELKAEFDALMADEAGEDHEGGDESDEEGESDEGDYDDVGDESDEGEDEFGGDEAKFGAAKPAVESKRSVHSVDIMREYVEKITAGHGAEKKGTGEGTEVGKGGSAAVNKQSTVARKNDMGGTSANIARGGAGQNPDGTSPRGTKAVKEIDVASKNVNRVGGNKGAQKFYSNKPKAKSGEGQTTGGTVSVNKTSIEAGTK